MPNGISHCYQLDQSISDSGSLGGIFHFYSNFDRTFYLANSGDPDLAGSALFA